MSVNPALAIVFQMSAAMFVLVTIAKTLRVEFDRMSLVVLGGLAIFLGYFLFVLVEAITAVFVSVLILRMIKVSGEPHPHPFVPPELDEYKGLQVERNE